MPPMTLNQLRAFLETARYRSFTAAAAALGVSQASVSELIRRLEDEHDVHLFTRGGRQLVTTTAGHELLRHAEVVVTAADDASRALRSVHGLDGGVASFGVLRNAEKHQLSDLVQRFNEDHPSVRVRLLGLNSVDVATAVAAGTLEAGLVVLPIDADGLQVTPWASAEVVYVSADSAHVTRPMTIGALAGSRLVLFEAHAGWRDPTRRQLSQRALAAGVRLDPLVEVEHVETALDLVSKGVADTIASRAVLNGPNSPTQTHVAELDPPLHETIAFIHKEGVSLSAATREMADMAHAMLRRDLRMTQIIE